MTKSLNSIQCQNVSCGHKGSFKVKKVGWYWPVALCGLFVWPLLLLLCLNTNQSVCPKCNIESSDKPLVREPRTGENKVYRVVVCVFLIFVAFIFYASLKEV